MMANPRAGGWCQTYSGKAAYPLDPRPEDFCIEDIAHALSLVCRFGGHSKRFYSVAEHSVRVSHICDPADALWGLLHDAAEAYCGDMVRPLKMDDAMRGYRAAERRIQGAICERFGLPPKMPDSVKRADNVMLATEARYLMAAHPQDWGLAEEPLTDPIMPFSSPASAELAFLGRFNQLYMEPTIAQTEAAPAAAQKG